MSYLRTYEEIIALIDEIDPVAYARTRNHLSGAVTKLSPYITRGIITLPQIRDRLLSRHRAYDCEKILQELAWREYFQNVWWAKGEAIFTDLRFPRTDWEHHELVASITNADTGIAVIDAAVKQLYTTGYLHNHERMWIASIVCNGVKAHWFPMGQWMYYHLLDGDLASNFLSWQWVAGTSVSKQYTVNQALINACSDISETTWLSAPREEALERVPESLYITESPNTLTMEYGSIGETIPDILESTQLYTPWTLDPRWLVEGSVRKILIIDPTWFDRFPVSSSVLDYIVRQGKLVIPELEVFVGTFAELPITEQAVLHAKLHQTNQTWKNVSFTETERLHPHVTGYYPSFFAFQKAFTKSKPRR